MMDGFAVGETAEALDFLAHGEVRFFPFQDDMFHWWWGRWELVVLGEVVQDCVVVCQHGVLELDLGG